MKHLHLLLILCPLLPAFGAEPEMPASKVYAEIRVLDAETGRGVPMVELETVNGLIFVTDNAGRVAFREPGLMDREIFFTVRSHGYEMKEDGFGYAGAKVIPRVGKVAEIKITRRNVAERLCRLTGEGLYRDSVLLGYKGPLPDPLNPGKVGGQDSVQAVTYKNKIYLFWGDAQQWIIRWDCSAWPGQQRLFVDPKDPKTDPSPGIPFDLFFGQQDRLHRAMMPLP